MLKELFNSYIQKAKRLLSSHEDRQIAVEGHLGYRIPGSQESLQSVRDWKVLPVRSMGKPIIMIKKSGSEISLTKKG